MKVTFDNCYEVKIQHRISNRKRGGLSCSIRSYYVARAHLSRLGLVGSLVSTSVFWYAGSCNLTCRQISKLKGVQQSMLEKMIVCRRRNDGQVGESMERWHSRIKQLKSHKRFLDWDRRYYRDDFKWAGRVAHFGCFAPLLPTANIAGTCIAYLHQPTTTLMTPSPASAACCSSPTGRCCRITLTDPDIVCSTCS